MTTGAVRGGGWPWRPVAALPTQELVSHVGDLARRAIDSDADAA